MISWVVRGVDGWLLRGVIEELNREEQAVAQGERKDVQFQWVHWTRRITRKEGKVGIVSV